MKNQEEIRKSIFDILENSKVGLGERDHLIGLLFELSNAAYNEGMNRGKEICLEVYKETR